MHTSRLEAENRNMSEQQLEESGVKTEELCGCRAAVKTISDTAAHNGGKIMFLNIRSMSQIGVNTRAINLIWARLLDEQPLR